MKTMLFAAGLGTRLRPVTETLPKPALPLLNIPLIAYPFEVLRPLKPSSLVINTHHLPERMESTARSLGNWNCPVTFSHEAEQILGSGGGVLRARKFLEGEGSFAAANGDEVFFPENPQILEEARKLHFKSKNDATLVVMENELVGTKFGGIWCDENNFVVGIGLKPPRQGLKGYHYTGFQILSDSIFDLIPATGSPNIFYDVFNPNFANGFRAQVIVAQGLWYEVGNVHDLLLTSYALLELTKQKSNAFLARIIERHRKGTDRWFSQSQLVYGSKTAKVDSSVQFSGHVTIGDRAEVPSACFLENCIVGADIKLAPGKYQNSILVSGTPGHP